MGSSKERQREGSMERKENMHRNKWLYGFEGKIGLKYSLLRIRSSLHHNWDDPKG
jgi:hypothetical protein